MIAQIIKRQNGSATLRFPSDRPNVNALKRKVPARYRSWNPGAKAWTIASLYVLAAECLFRDRFAYVDVFEPGMDRTRHRRPQPIRATDQAHAALHLLPSVPPALVGVAYRTLAMAMHPNHGGTHDAMVELNRAYQALSDRGAA